MPTTDTNDLDSTPLAEQRPSSQPASWPEGFLRGMPSQSGQGKKRFLAAAWYGGLSSYGVNPS
eukprot:9488834-Pyramimonas_sp.AAC.2